MNFPQAYRYVYALNTFFKQYALLWMLALWLLAGLIYLWGLAGNTIPSNGDEMVYIHITRMTAALDTWLPLQSAMPDMRNTKPPLLFWQGIATGFNHDTQHLDLFALRLPSLIYTLLTSLLVAALTTFLGLAVSVKANFQWRTMSSAVFLSALQRGIWAALIYLAFFHTFRYGRPFLTNAAEIFWWFLATIWLAWFLRELILRPQSQWGWRYYLLLTASGVCLGFASLYKSPALILPFAMGMGLGFAVIYAKFQQNDSLHFSTEAKTSKHYLALARWLTQLMLKPQALRAWLSIVCVCALALGIFALWFVFDPDPTSVWQEFIVKENIGKFEPSKTHYFQQFFFGTGSVWTLLIAFLANAGVLMPLMAGGLWLMLGMTFGSIEQARITSQSIEPVQLQKLDFAWIVCMIIAFFIVFAVPTQRSGRYLLDIMPLVAIVMASVWERLPSWLFVLSQLLCASIVILWSLALISLVGYGGVTLGQLFTTTTLSLLILSVLLLLFVLTAVFVQWRYPASQSMLSVWQRSATLLSAFVLLAFINSSLQVLDGNGTQEAKQANSGIGVFSESTKRRLAGEWLSVACQFRASDEAYRFLLPEANIVAEHTWNPQPPTPYRSVITAINTHEAEVLAQCESCEIIDHRVTLRPRSNPNAIPDSIKVLMENLREHVWSKEWIVFSPRVAAANKDEWSEQTCQ